MIVEITKVQNLLCQKNMTLGSCSYQCTGTSDSQRLGGRDQISM